VGVFVKSDQNVVFFPLFPDGKQYADFDGMVQICESYKYSNYSILHDMVEYVA